MAVTLLDGIKFADDSYSHIQNLPDGFERLSIKLEGEIPADFHAEAYINPITKEVVVSYRGTDGITDFNDDALLALYQVPEQAEVAKKFMENVINKVKKNFKDDFDEINFTVTGHSLGGYLAQQALSTIIAESSINQDNVSGILFNSPGANSDNSYSNIVALRDDMDVVSLSGGDSMAKNTISVNGDSNTILGSHSLDTLKAYLDKGDRQL